MAKKANGYIAVGAAATEDDLDGHPEVESHKDGTDVELVLVKHLDTKGKMKQMAISGSADRAPTEVGTRRRLAIAAGVFCLLVLTMIVIAETFLREQVGLKASRNRAVGRDDVVILTFSVNGAALPWNATAVLGSREFASAVVQELSKAPFHDFSLEFQASSGLDLVELAIIEEDSIPLEDSGGHCPAESKPVISKVAEMATKRCSMDTSSAFRNSIKCFKSKGQQSPSEDVELVNFWMTVFAAVTVGEAYTSRCCNFDQAYFDAEKGNVVEICKASLHDLEHSNSNFLRYIKKEGSGRCQDTMCGCACFMDAEPSKNLKSLSVHQSRCPKFPESVRDGNVCAAVARFVGRQPLCGELPILASKYEVLLRTKGITLGENPRCYGTYHS